MIDTKKNIRLALVDDHQIVIDGLIAAFQTYPSINIVATATSGPAILERLAHSDADVLLTDVVMPEMNGQTLARQVRKNFPNLRIIALSMSGNGMVVDEMINDSDIAGYLLKQSTIAELVLAIEKVYAGGQYFQDPILSELDKVSTLKKQVEETRLTSREKQIIELIEKDFSSKQIAEHLCIAVRTVETHRKSICKKTGTSNALALVRWAREHQLLSH